MQGMLRRQLQEVLQVLNGNPVASGTASTLSP
jgi:hypothetical protein